ncbi:MAG: glutamate cyclase domain-containing protein [Planctomycetaceae bacterium]
MPHHDALIDEIDSLIRRDPARRGLIATESQFGPLCSGHLAQAARSLAETGRCVAIVTGFYIPHASPPAAETDGPPGALFLARVFERIGIETMVVTDENCLAAVRAAAVAAEYPIPKVVALSVKSASWVEDYFRSDFAARLTHLVAVERAGPSHTAESLASQKRSGAVPVAEFEATVPGDSRDRCHNMRGMPIDEYGLALYRLFEDHARFRPGITTIGIGDGANEIGMGIVAWEELRRRLEGAHAPCIPCRISTDWNIIAGTSNWGAYALAACVLLQRGRLDVLEPLDRPSEKNIIEQMVANGPAVDGVTGRQEATVDGLPFLTYIQPLEGIRRLLLPHTEHASKETSI